MKYFLSIAFFLLSLTAFSSEIITQSKIKSVIVFQQAAQIQRTFSAEVPIGKHQVVLSDLSTQIDQNSIQLVGDKSTTILSLYFRMNHLKDKKNSKKIQLLKDSVKLVSSSLKDVQNKIWILNEEKSLLNLNKSLPQTGNNNTTEELIKRVNFYRTRMKEILEKEKKDNLKKNEIQIILNKLNAQLRQTQNKASKSVGEIVVELNSTSTKTINFIISYNVRNAGWYPIYNLKSNSISSPLDLEYNAKVYQKTGIDWEDVKMSLSTANPQSNIQKPSLVPWRLVFQTANTYDKMGYASAASNRRSDYGNNIESKDEDIEDVQVSNFLKKPIAAITQNRTSVSFDLNTNYTILSNNTHYGVTVASYSLDAQYTYYAAPKLRNKAFLIAQTSDWYQYNLISGKSNFFFQNTYVGNSILNLSGMQDTLDISLGIDNQILIERKRILDFCKSSAIGADKKEEIGIATSVTNNKNVAIELIVEDQIPISSNNKIEVNLIAAKKAIYSEKTGKLKWTIKLKPGETKVLKFSYAVKFPKGRRINL